MPFGLRQWPPSITPKSLTRLFSLKYALIPPANSWNCHRRLTKADSAFTLAGTEIFQLLPVAASTNRSTAQYHQLYNSATSQCPHPPYCAFLPQLMPHTHKGETRNQEARN